MFSDNTDCVLIYIFTLKNLDGLLLSGFPITDTRLPDNFSIKWENYF